MNMNVGKLDQRTRIIAGISLLVLGFVFKSAWGLVGLIPLITGLVRYCPAYSILGKNTCEQKKLPE